MVVSFAMDGSVFRVLLSADFFPVAATSTWLLLITLLVFVLSIALCGLNSGDDRRRLLIPPGPKGFPIIGSLHLLANHANPWDAFVQLRASYGDVFRIVLGGTDCVVVSSVDAIREVLLEKADSFGGRPNFLRYHALFGGDRDRSLALCDWSKTQKLRRRLAMPYVFPRPDSSNFETLEIIIDLELKNYFQLVLNECFLSPDDTTTFDKTYFSQITANMMLKYFCSKSYRYDDDYFKQMVKRFDVIFHDVNDGFALDFLPWLLPFYLSHLYTLYSCGQFIRRFLVETLLKDWSIDDDALGRRLPRDFMDVILMRTNAKHVKRKRQRLTYTYALYELEDILGGHSAVSCFWARILTLVAACPDVQRHIQSEVDIVLRTTGEESVRLAHRASMPYLQAVILETLRMTTSPVVPHVATEDTSIRNFHIKKGTMVFINNYYLNRSPEFWQEPGTFNPSRFLTAEHCLLKPDHFMPFGLGKRSCMGFQLLQSITFLATANLFRQFDVLPSKEMRAPPIEAAKLSVYDESARVIFKPRL